MAGYPAVGRKEQEGRHAGVLYGRPNGVSHRGSRARSGRRGRVFHGGGLASGPHLQAAKTKASFLICIAQNDDEKAPKDKDVLKETFEAAKLPAEIEVYGAAHGWCPPDSQVYNEQLAEKAWSRLLALYGKALA